MTLTNQMDVQTLYKIARMREPFPRECIDENKVRRSYLGLRRYLKEADRKSGLLYGVDTCFGPHAFKKTPDRVELQYNLVNHLTVIPEKNSEWLDVEEVRAVLAARILVLGKGYSGVKIELIDKLVEILNTNDLPRIPLRGSLGASGDLIPLSYIARHLQNQGWKWEEKEAIAVTNGTSFMVGLVSYQFTQFLNLVRMLEDLLKVQIHIIPTFPDAFHSAVAECRQSIVIERFLSRMRPWILPKEKKEGVAIQDSYVIRCVPLIWEAVLERLNRLHEDLNVELHKVSDNPIYSFDEDRFIEAGLFYGSTISLLADELNLIMGTMANWIERTIQYLLDPKENGGVLPLMLSPEPGRYAGLAGLGLYATHLAAEIRRDSHAGSLQSLPTNGGNQNIVPMGALSAIRNRRTLRDIKILTAIYFHVLLQAYYFRNEQTDTPEIFQKAWGIWNPADINEAPLRQQDRILELIEKHI